VAVVYIKAVIESDGFLVGREPKRSLSPVWHAFIHPAGISSFRFYVAINSSKSRGDMAFIHAFITTL